MIYELIFDMFYLNNAAFVMGEVHNMNKSTMSININKYSISKQVSLSKISKTVVQSYCTLPLKAVHSVQGVLCTASVGSVQQEYSDYY